MARNLDAKHEKVLKGLLKQPDNRRCINCETLVSHPDHPARDKSLGPGDFSLDYSIRCLSSIWFAAGPAICGHELQHLCVHGVQRSAVSLCPIHAHFYFLRHLCLSAWPFAGQLCPDHCLCTWFGLIRSSALEYICDPKCFAHAAGSSAIDARGYLWPASSRRR